MSKKYIGSFGVDSGQVLIGDPCYLKDWDNNDGVEFNKYPEYAGKYSYLGSCNATLENETQAGELGGFLAVVATTGYGDGMYPVYATYNSDNRISKITIEFEQE